MTIYLRPDEKTANTDIEKSKKFDKSLKLGLKTAGSIAATATGVGIAGKAASKILPFLNEYVPKDLAMKGLSAVSPGIAAMLRKGQDHGLDIQEGFDFVKKQITQEKKPQEDRNIIQQYSPELFQFLNDEIQKGRSPIEAGALAELQNNFKNIIKKMADDHKAPFSSILQTVFGEAGQPNAQQAQTQQTQQGGVSDDQLMAAFQNILKM